MKNAQKNSRRATRLIALALATATPLTAMAGPTPGFVGQQVEHIEGPWVTQRFYYPRLRWLATPALDIITRIAWFASDEDDFRVAVRRDKCQYQQRAFIGTQRESAVRRQRFSELWQRNVDLESWRESAGTWGLIDLAGDQPGTALAATAPIYLSEGAATTLGLGGATTMGGAEAVTAIDGAALEIGGYCATDAAVIETLANPTRYLGGFPNVDGIAAGAEPYVCGADGIYMGEGIFEADVALSGSGTWVAEGEALTTLGGSGTWIAEGEALTTLGVGGTDVAATEATATTAGASSATGALAILVCSGAATQLAIADDYDEDSTLTTGIWKFETEAWVDDELYFGPASRTLPAGACTDGVYDANGRLLPAQQYLPPVLRAEPYESWENISPLVPCEELAAQPKGYRGAWILEQYEAASPPLPRAMTMAAEVHPLEPLAADDPLAQR